MSSLPAVSGTSKADPDRPGDASAPPPSPTSSTSSRSTREAMYSALVRALVVLFARPVRLFRPVKLSSLQLLESLAKREGRTLSLRYLWRVLRREKWSFLPHLLGPPVLYQTLVGFSLFTTYTLVEGHLVARHKEKKAAVAGPKQEEDGEVVEAKTKKPSHAEFTPLSSVLVAGAAAGSAQCILSAPLDNVRFILENGLGRAQAAQAEEPKAAKARHRDLSRRRGKAIRPRLGLGLGAASSSSPMLKMGSKAPALQISWRAVAKAAVLPFLPVQAHTRVVDQVKSHSARGAAAAATAASLATPETGAGKAGSGAAVAVAAKDAKRVLWQETLKAWRGGLHGSGLVMSLCRDSVGFAAFFAVFELSRRSAYHCSMAIDRLEAWLNTVLPLLRFGSSSSSEGDGGVVSSHRHRSDEMYVERADRMSSSEIQPDFSYNASRTLLARLTAALVLVIGGAIGATLYELVGRPFELMRIVIFRGTKEWERKTAAAAARARAKADVSSSLSATRALARARRRGAPDSLRSTAATFAKDSPTSSSKPRVRIRIHGARARATGLALAPFRSTSRVPGMGMFLALRSSNTMGSSSSRVASFAGGMSRRSGHPLFKKGKQHVRARNGAGRMEESGPPASVERRQRSEVTMSSPTAATPQLDSVPTADSAPQRPSTLSLLLAHATTSDPTFLTRLQTHLHLKHLPHSIKLAALCGKAYFVNVFLVGAGAGDTYVGARKADARTSRARAAVERSRTGSGSEGGGGNSNEMATTRRSQAAVTSPAQPFTRPPSTFPPPASSTRAALIWTIRDRGHHAWDGAMRWTSMAWGSRWGWALRKMATPYGLGFLAFAWFGGDLNR